MSDKQACLFVCAQSPSITGAAGNRVARERIMKLAGEYEVDLVLIVNRRDPVSANLARELGVRSVAVFRVGKFAKLLGVLTHLASIPPRYSTRLSRAVLRHLGDMIEANRYALARYEFSQAAPYHGLLRSRVRSVLAAHDIQLQVVLRASLLERLLFSAPTYSFEERLFRCFDEITVLSNKDKSLIHGLYPYCNVTIEKPSLSTFVHSVRRVAENIEAGTLLFWGAMHRHENEQAVLFFVRHCLPAIRAHFPGAVLYVVGNAPPARMRKLQSDGVVVTGFVEDPTPYFERAALGVVPLLRGAGVKLKTLEMLKAGLPVVSTYVGAEGVDDVEHGLTVVDPRGFAEAVINALERPAPAPVPGRK